MSIKPFANLQLAQFAVQSSANNRDNDFDEERGSQVALGLPVESSALSVIDRKWSIRPHLLRLAHSETQQTDAEQRRATFI